MRLADGLIEAAAAVLFAYVALSVIRSLIRSRHVSALAIAFTGVFAVSVPHRALHAGRLLSGVGVTDLSATLVDASVLVCLLAYVLLRRRVHPIAGFTLIADQVGLARLQGQIDDLTAQAETSQRDARELRGELGIERGRNETFTRQLREIIAPAADLADHAREIAAGGASDHDRLRRDAEALVCPLKELAKALGLT